MRALLLAALLLSACAGRDTSPDAWVFRPPEGQPSMIEAFEDDLRRDPTGTGYAVGNLIGAIGLVILKFVSP